MVLWAWYNDPSACTMQGISQDRTRDCCYSEETQCTTESFRQVHVLLAGSLVDRHNNVTVPSI